jgi:hypothetical protein
MIDTMIDSIRAAVADGPTAEARAAGIAACRSLLAALEPPPAVQPDPAPQIPIAAIASALRGANPDQLLDLAIAKLRTLVPADAHATAHRKLDIMMVGGRKP